MDSLVLYAIALLLLIHWTLSMRRNKEIAFLLVFLAAGATLALYQGVDMLLLLLGVLIFNGMASTYYSKKNYVFFLLALFFIQMVQYSTVLIAQAMLLGFMSAAYFFLGNPRRASVQVERRRDVAQIVMGLAFIAAFVLVAAVYVKLLLISAILIASVVGNFSVSNGKSKMSKILRSFERRDAVFGQGAVWLAAGALVAMSFLNNLGIAAVLVALFVGDAVATLAGTTYRWPLPYNRKKSLAGTAAYFAVTAVISFPFIGPLCLLTALVAAVVESAPWHIDDNFDTAVILTALLLLLGFAGIA